MLTLWQKQQTKDRLVLKSTPCCSWGRCFPQPKSELRGSYVKCKNVFTPNCGTFLCSDNCLWPQSPSNHKNNTKNRETRPESRALESFRRIFHRAAANMQMLREKHWRNSQNVRESCFWKTTLRLSLGAAQPHHYYTFFTQFVQRECKQFSFKLKMRQMFRTDVFLSLVSVPDCCSWFWRKQIALMECTIVKYKYQRKIIVRTLEAKLSAVDRPTGAQDKTVSHRPLPPFSIIFNKYFHDTFGRKWAPSRPRLVMGLRETYPAK